MYFVIDVNGGCVCLILCEIFMKDGYNYIYNFCEKF